MKNSNTYPRALRALMLALPLLFLGPVLIHNAFQNTHHWLHWIVLAVGIAVCGLGVYKAFQGVKMMADTTFDNDRKQHQAQQDKNRQKEEDQTN